MAKARPRDLAEEGVQGGVRQEGHDGPEGLGGLQEGGQGGHQEGVQGRSGDGRGVEPALDNHLTGTLGGGERLSHIGIICIALYPNFLLLLLAGCRCIVARSMPHRTVTSHEWKYLREVESDKVISSKTCSGSVWNQVGS